ncbi:MAG TPA: hypothetical protein VLF89_07245 [Candidatus Saccharimonadales bacterium]|nr:hypothetical protein [Candidatus Saccharimonadales bacterium]
MRIPLKNNYIFFLIFSLILISICSFLWSYINHFIILYGDATSHLNIARRVIDNRNPGFGQLGSSWLPLFHVLLIPFAANDFLYRTGIAGYCVNSFLYVAVGYFFFKILTYHFPNRKNISFILTLLFVLNINLLYFQTTAMGEMLLIATSLGGIYYLVKYIADTTSTENLSLAAFFVFLSSLNRYEGWFLACTETAFIFFYILVKDKNYKRAEGKTILFGVLALLGIATWLLYNLAIFHDPLNFIHDTYTAAGQQKVLYSQGLLQTKHNLIRSIQTFSFAIYDVSGAIFSLLSIISGIWYIFYKKKRQYLPIIILFISLFFFEVLTLFLGITAMYVEQLHPFRLFNVRYALFLYPGMFLLVSIYILSQKKNIFMYIALLLLAIQNILLIYPQEAITLREGKSLYGTDIGMVEAGKYLHDHYQGGSILASSGAVDPLFLFSEIPMKEYIYEGNRGLWTQSLITPQKHVTWIVITNAHNPLDFVAKKLENTPQLRKYYRLVIRKRNINLYERN